GRVNANSNTVLLLALTRPNQPLARTVHELQAPSLRPPEQWLNTLSPFPRKVGTPLHSSMDIPRGSALPAHRPGFSRMPVLAASLSGNAMAGLGPLAERQVRLHRWLRILAFAGRSRWIGLFPFSH